MKVCWACETPYPCPEHGAEPPVGYDFGPPYAPHPPVKTIERVPLDLLNDLR